jgi:hypothetical protein
MATTTTNFGWDIPQSTDLVKDGATAIAALGQDIDTAFVDFKGGTTGQVLKKTSGTDLDVEWGTASSGLTLINSTTATGAIGSISINDVFSSTYKNYFITISPTGANGNVVLYFRLRASGTDNTSSYSYVTRNFYFSDGSATSIGNSNSTSFIGLGYPTAQNNGLAMSLNVFNPYVAVRTSVFGQGIGASPTDNSYSLTNVGGAHSDNGLFDGFSLVRASGTGMELIIKTYGMAN